MNETEYLMKNYGDRGWCYLDNYEQGKRIIYNF